TVCIIEFPFPFGQVTVYHDIRDGQKRILLILFLLLRKRQHRQQYAQYQPIIFIFYHTNLLSPVLFSFLVLYSLFLVVSTNNSYFYTKVLPTFVFVPQYTIQKKEIVV